MLQWISKRPCPGPQCRLENCNLGISLYAMTRRLRFKASTFTASNGAVGMDFRVRAVLVLQFCDQYPSFLAWVFLVHLTLILGGVLETFIPHWINLCRNLVCFPMVVTVPKYLPPVFHFMEILFSHLSGCHTPCFGGESFVIEVLPDQPCKVPDVAGIIPVYWFTVLVLYVYQQSII